MTRGATQRRWLGRLVALLALGPGIAPATELPIDLHRYWHAPRAADFAQAASHLTPALQALCDAPPDQAQPTLAQARRQWLATLAAWGRLSAVAMGPVLERRAQRQIDFTPTRPRLIEKAIRAAPRTPADMELIGTPAKGLPALEWLLWTQPVQPATPACRYAVQVADEVHREARALASAGPSATDAQTTLTELVNQWVGGLERLRWAGMEMPLRVTLTGGGRDAPDYPRRASGASGMDWAAQWEGLKALATGPVSLASVLTQQGQAPVAAALARMVDRADAAMTGLDTSDSERILVAARALADLKRLMEDHVAPALGVSIGFSDADGD